MSSLQAFKYTEKELSYKAYKGRMGLMKSKRQMVHPPFSIATLLWSKNLAPECNSTLPANKFRLLNVLCYNTLFLVVTVMSKHWGMMDN